MIHKNIKVLTWFNLFIDFKLYAPVAIIYFAQVSGSFALGMAVFSIATVSSALFEIPTGIFSDIIGRKKTVILGAISAVIFTIFYAIGQSFWVLAIGALFEGLSLSFYSGNNDALLYDTLTEQKEKHEFSEFQGKISSMVQVGLAISAIFGSIIASWSLSLIFWISVIPQLVCVFLSFSIIEPQIKSERSGNIYLHLKEALVEFIHNKKLRLLSISSIITGGIGEASFQFQAAFYNTVWPIWAIGIAKTISFTGGAIGSRFAGKFIKKYGATQAMMSSNLYNRFINIVSVAFPTIFSPLLMSSTSLLAGTSWVAKDTLFQEEFREGKRATMGSLISFVGNIFFGIISITLGFIADQISPATALLIFQILLLPTLWLYWKLVKYKV